MATMEYAEYVRQLAPRRPGSVPFLYAGRISNEPPIEVVADFADPDEIVVFHAMLLRRSQAVEAEIDVYHPDLFDAIVDYQRA